ncbi:response regulator [Streptomyces sp. Je 1-4]|uniref:response regulator n=1 Tax=Streptomyces TaxID=1883 RepID=UPI00140F1648|nr:MULTISPECIES: response regulator [unclassified Streptomyces]QIK07575.1 response regulator [Streptomyces sp. ID38640]UYB41157.1 response regulator [Streptomyces sp. Je 1-4]UZQ37331.1 response regulator [Streptomyces sp. Je 1-4] [Streptomyces sp. Je 1-4 4N24]UZQ44748.1 response regulator [Streptomyces sp. Je 1-4] [Streptomyces sp. Je 1-4 4N24_ara]
MTTTPDTSSSILIVDDMEENLVALEAVLGSLTQKVVRARSGEEALKAMLREEFAVVLIDVLMPGMNGFETAANIKGLDQTKDVPIILLTGASVDPNYAYRGYTVGAADFLIKPFDPWLLRTKVNVFLDLHRKNRQLAAQAEQLKRLLTSDERPGGEGPPAAPTTAATTATTGTDTGAPTAPPVVSASAPASPTAPQEFPDPQHRPEPGQQAGHPPLPPEGPGAPAPSEPLPQPAAPAAGDASRLAEIAGQLAEVELLLRDAKGSDKERLADRIAELEASVGRLMVSRGT